MITKEKIKSELIGKIVRMSEELHKGKTIIISVKNGRVVINAVQ